MKSMMMTWASLLCGGALIACSGEVSTIGSGQDPGKGGSSATSGTGGSTTVGGKGSGTAGAAMGGKDPGAGGTTQVKCKTDEDCAVDATCELCADGSEVCDAAHCVAGGTCVVKEASCPNLIKCATAKECPVRDEPCKPCADGSEVCPSAECVTGFCRDSFGVCDDPLDECKTAADCGPEDAKCVLCGDGSCAKTDCLKGTCQQSCPNTSQSCKYVEECPAVGDVCVKCPETSECAVQACLHNSCQMVCPVE